MPLPPEDTSWKVAVKPFTVTLGVPMTGLAGLTYLGVTGGDFAAVVPWVVALTVKVTVSRVIPAYP